MKIEVHRQACCAQDDQMGPLARTFELPDRCSIEDLVNAVVASRFLQYSSTHTALHCRIAGKEVAVVFSPYEVPARGSLFVVAPDTAVQDIASAKREVEFVFDRS
ncbi:hypothetical protein [Variovorax sp. IB41]|uniref:hypothetical protein n=1 Tax=Variovorax sp. IB41 TaxID=2779370 RepID=UPI0018E75451|nr:hypothetical protein [Variovorax sp. IB41]MBJ2157528.1 hypothetical protein [Variovorax sp. IB41]